MKLTLESDTGSCSSKAQDRQTERQTDRETERQTEALLIDVTSIRAVMYSTINSLRTHRLQPGNVADTWG